MRRPSSKAPFTHFVGYLHAIAAFAGEVDSLLDAASYGSRWVALVTCVSVRDYVVP